MNVADAILSLATSGAWVYLRQSPILQCLKLLNIADFRFLHKRIGKKWTFTCSFFENYIEVYSFTNYVSHFSSKNSFKEWIFYIYLHRVYRFHNRRIIANLYLNQYISQQYRIKFKYFSICFWLILQNEIYVITVEKQYNKMEHKFNMHINVLKVMLPMKRLEIKKDK